jgi:outer membrane protein OmpA-like peptidoglycan-associated protein
MGQIGRLRIICALLAAAFALTACANGRPNPWACAAVGALGGAGGGIAAGHEYLEHSNDEWKTGLYAASGAVVLGTAGYFLCKAFAKEEAAAPPPPAPAPEPLPPRAMEPPVAEKLILRGVNFDFDKDVIRPDAAVILDEAASILTEDHPGASVGIEGHTDWTGPDAYNQGLSGRRANSVRKYLVSHGVDASRLTTAGFGESRPIASNETREGRALNRRVELQVQE